jgi:hypothetical protein
MAKQGAALSADWLSSFSKAQMQLGCAAFTVKSTHKPVQACVQAMDTPQICWVATVQLPCPTF